MFLRDVLTLLPELADPPLIALGALPTEILFFFELEEDFLEPEDFDFALP